MATQLPYTPVDQIPQIIERVRKNWDGGRSRPLEYRKNQIKQLGFLVQDNEEAFVQALASDLGRDRLGAYIGDLNIVKSDVKHVLSHLSKWAKPESPGFSLVWAATRPKTYKEPKGVVLIIGPFNYPINLLLVPLIGAIAGGNAAVIKPSEQTPACSALLTKLLPQYLDTDLFAIVNGAKDETTKLLEIKFDHIFYTGSTAVGRIVSQAAAKHLCPVTLELGGKSPVIVMDGNIDIIAKRILWGKTINSGQTCIAPDYILCPRALRPKLVEAFKRAHKQFYPDSKTLGGDQVCKYVTPNHYERGKKLLSTSKGKVELGGNFDDSLNKLEPTIVSGVTLDDSLMESELFGPILPIVDCDTKEEAVKIINQGGHPLALYVFTANTATRDYIFNNTRSGSLVHNDTVVHFTVPGLPFGGVGESGQGNYHGKRTFDTFVYERATMSVPFFIEFALAARYPPATAAKLQQMVMIGGASNFSFSRPTGRSSSSVSRVAKRLLSGGWKVALLYALIRYVREQRSRL